MNDILGTFFACLLSELVFDDYTLNESGDEWKMFEMLHSPDRIQADLYCLFQHLMEMGIKDLF